MVATESNNGDVVSREEIDSAGEIYLKDIDWGYWLNMPGLEASEAAALITGINPDLLTEIEDDKNHIAKQLTDDYNNTLRILQRSQRKKILDSLPTMKDVLDWTNTYEIKCSNVFIENTNGVKRPRNYKSLYKKYKNLYNDEMNKNQNIDDLNPKNIRTLYSIIYCLAWAVFNYNEKNNSASKIIYGIVEDAGFNTPKEQTIRSALNDARSFLSEDGTLPKKMHDFVYTAKKRLG